MTRPRAKRTAVTPKSRLSQRAAAVAALLVDNTLYCSGQVGMDYTSRYVPEDPEQQIVLAFENLGEVLTEAGGDFKDLVDITTYHTKLADLALFSEIKKRFIADAPFPAWTAIGVTALARPGLIVEIRAIAHLG